MAEVSLAGLVGAADRTTNSFLDKTYPALAAAIEEPIFWVAVLYWAIAGYRIYAGEEGWDAKRLALNMMMTSAVFATLNWSGFAKVIYVTFATTMEGAAATTLSGQGTATMIDGLFNSVASVATLLMGAKMYQFGMIILGFGLFIINCLLLMVAIVYMTLAKFGLAVTMLLLPIFVGFFFFPVTRQWGINWISAMLNFCLIYVLVIVVVQLGFSAFGDAIGAIGEATKTADAALIGAQSIANIFVVEGVLVIFLLQVKGWAAALSGGISVQGMSALSRVVGLAKLGFK